MAFQTTTAFDYHDLLDQLRIFLTATNVQASGVLTLAANIANTETVTIGSTTYTFQTTLTDSANNVLIGASASATIDNLIAAVTAGAGAGTTYGTGTVANSLATAAAGAGDTMDVTAVRSGTLGNSVATTETSANASFANATLTGGVNGAGWTQLEHTPATGRDGGIPDPINDTVRLASVQTLTVRGPGTGVGREVFVTIQTIGDTVQSNYSWRPYGHTAYNSLLPVTSQAGVGPSPFFSLIGGSMTYWFFANDRRFIVVARSGTTYTSSYCGFLTPNALPAEYPFPLYIAGNYLANVEPPFANARNRFIADPGDGSAYFRTVTGDWVPVQNHTADTTADTGLAGGFRATLWPFRSGSRATGTPSNTSWSFGGLRQLRPNAADEIIVMPCNLIDGRNNVNAGVGLVDGVYGIGGFNRTAEETLTIGNRFLTVFSNVFRSSTRDFMAIEETV